MTKAEARAQYRRARRAISGELQTQHSHAIAETLVPFIQAAVPSGALIGLHAGVLRMGEVQTTALHAALAERYRLAYPKVLGRGLAFHRVQQRDDLAPGFHGVPEPVLADPVAVEEMALVVVPGVAFTAEGLRLGQGGGHYDRLLESLAFRATTIGIAHAVQLADRLPCTSRDQRVHGVVTEAGWALRPVLP